MKISEIDDLNQTIGNFILKLSKFECKITEEAPDIWESILLSISHLSDISILLDAISKKELKEEIDLYNKFALANGLPFSQSPNIEKDIDIDLGKYTEGCSHDN